MLLTLVDELFQELANLEDDYQVALEEGKDDVAAELWAMQAVVLDRLAAMSELVVERR